MRQLFGQTKKFSIRQSDVGAIILLKDLEERKITLEDVGRVYVVDAKGDYIEDAPQPREEDDEFDEEEW